MITKPLIISGLTFHAGDCGTFGAKEFRTGGKVC